MIEKIKQQIVQAYSGLTFEDKVHLYFWNGRRVPKSVSAKVEEVVSPFDEAYWAKYCSQSSTKEEYVGLTEHEIIHRWQTINQLACDLGTDTHDFLEHFTGHQSPRSPQEIAGIKFLKWLYEQKTSTGAKRYTILFKELRMYSRLYNIAGTADLIVYDHELNAVVIFDYKTNKDLFKIFGWMLGVFSFLQSHAFNHYQVQLSYYQLLLEEIGVTVAERNIVYLQADEEYVIIPLENFILEIKDYLKTSKNEYRRGNTKSAISVQ